MLNIHRQQMLNVLYLRKAKKITLINLKLGSMGSIIL